MKGKPLVAGPGAHDDIVHLAARAQEGGVVEVWPVTPKPVVADADRAESPTHSHSQSCPCGACGLSFTYAKVVSSGAIMPARAPASIDMLHMVMRPSIERERIALPRNSST